MKKLLWIGQSATATTGLGKSTRYILQGLKNKFKIFNAGYNFEPRNINALGIDYEISGLDLNGSTDPNELSRQVVSKINEIKPDITVFFGDIRYFLYLPSIVKDIHDTILVGYITVDCCNLPMSWLATIGTFDHIITTSKFASDEIKLKFDRECPYVYLGYNPKFFNRENKKCLPGLEDKQLVAIRVDRNQSRKNWPATLDLWNRWSADKNVNLIFHTVHESEEQSTANLKEYMGNLMNFRAKATSSTSYLLSEELFSGLLKTAEIFLTTTMGEGFGLTILESAACGIPSIGIDFSASGELLRCGAGIAIPPAAFFANQEGVKMALPNINEFMQQLDNVYSDKRFLKELSDKAYEWSKKFMWENTTEKLIDELDRDNLKTSILKVSVISTRGQEENLNIERVI